MKGTLYSSDFVKFSNGDIKLLEYNTDTDFPSASLEHFNWSNLTDVLESQSIDTIHVVYKEFQQILASNISESIHINSPSITWEETVETNETIYPGDVTDSSTKFVLRLAYNEAAIFDSEYCKNGINLYKLYTDSGSESHVIPHYVSSSADEYVFDNLTRVVNQSTIPDITIKKGEYGDGVQLDFYKIGNSSDTIENRITSFVSTVYTDGDIISTYADTSENNHVHSYRSANILYDTDLKYLNIGMYKIKSWVDLPTSISYDDSQIVNKIDNKHRYEFATNWPKEYWKNQGGVFSESELINSSGSIVLAKDTIVNDKYVSLNVAGLPDTDNIDQVMNWTSAGSTLPAGTAITSSALITKESSSVEYGVLSEISSSNNSSIIVGNSLPMLTYNEPEDAVRFVYTYNLVAGQHKLFDSTGSLYDIVENNLIIFENEESTYELNMETDDTYMINNSGVLLIAHNPFYGSGPPEVGETCFLAGTQIITVDGSKNIEDIVVGDVVQSWDESTKSFVSATVSEIDHSHTVGDHLEGCNRAGYGEAGVFKLMVDMMEEPENLGDAGFRFTPEHPFLTQDGWKAISPLVNQEPWLTQQEEVLTLEVGDFIKFDDNYRTTGEEGDGKWIRITDIQFEPMDPSTPVYNFTVPTMNNYCVNYIVAHNK